jgi:hypothetical protein
MKKRILIAAIILATTFAGQMVVPGASLSYESYVAVQTNAYYRTELYFGRSIPGGGQVSDDEWEKFLADVVTPRFPDGFTILNATGQYREKNGMIDKEPSEILVFFYAVKTRTTSRRKIEEIRRAYIKQFKQESVLRLDYPHTLNVTF